MKKLKIAQITPYYYPSIGGVQGVAKYLAEELVNRGHQVDVITAYRDHKERPKLNVPKFEIVNGVSIYRYKSILNIGHMSLMPGLITHLLKHKYDVLHYHTYRHPLCDISAFIGKLKNSVNILHGHGPFFEKGEINSIRQTLYNIYDKFAKLTVINWTDCFIALNDYEKKRFLCLGIDETRIKIIPNAAEKDCFLPRDPTSFLVKHNLLGKKIMLFLGIINKSKRPDVLIKALKKVSQVIPDICLLLVGPDGGMLNEVEESVKRLGLNSFYKYIGPLYGKEKQEALSSADVLVLPSDLESFGMVIIEAFAHGIPVVATNARGPLNIIENNKTGFIVEKGDVDSFAEKVIKILVNDELRHRLSENARNLVYNNYRLDNIIADIEKIYLELLKN